MLKLKVKKSQQQEYVQEILINRELVVTCKRFYRKVDEGTPRVPRVLC